MKRKGKLIALSVGVCLICSVIVAGGLEYWSHSHGVAGLKLWNNSHFLPSYKTNTTAHNVQKGKYIKSAWTTIKEGSTSYKKATKNYPKTHNSTVYCTNERGNNPFYSQTFSWGWAYN